MMGIAVCIAVAFFLAGSALIDIVAGPVAKTGNTTMTMRYLRGEKDGLKSGQRVRKKKKSRKLKLGVQSEKQQLALIGSMIFIVSVVFLKNIFLAVGLSGVSLYYPKHKLKEEKNKKRERLNIQFRDAMMSVANSLRAGNSLQTAIERCQEDLARIYRHEKNCPIIAEWEIMISELKLGKPLDEVLHSFKDRMDMEDVDTFVNSANIIMRKGGNMTEVLGNVATTIGDRIEVKRDIQTLTAGKRSEAKLLTLMPIVLVGIIMMLSPDYLAPMYDKPLGKMLAALGFLMLIANYFIGKSIINIDI